jgi:hypothetical protein
MTDFDVVLDTLQERIAALWSMTESNPVFNAMDQIRLEQIAELKLAAELWENSKLEPKPCA